MKHYSNSQIAEIVEKYHEKFGKTFNTFNAARSGQLDDLIAAMEQAIKTGQPISPELAEQHSAKAGLLQ